MKILEGFGLTNGTQCKSNVLLTEDDVVIYPGLTVWTIKEEAARLTFTRWTVDKLVLVNMEVRVILMSSSETGRVPDLVTIGSSTPLLHDVMNFSNTSIQEVLKEALNIEGADSNED